MKLPGINLGHIDIPEMIHTFLHTLRAIETKLDRLIELTEEANRNATLDRLGRTTRHRQDADRRRMAPAGLIPTDCDMSRPCACVDPDDADLDGTR